MKISQEILDMVPYKPGKPISEAKREYGLKFVYKLASNENPLGPSPKALEAVTQALKEQHLYPDPSAYEMVSAVSTHFHVPREMIGFGNGSDEIIDLLTRIYCEPQDGMLTSVAAFQAYEVSASASRVKAHKVPLTKDMRFDLPAMAEYFLTHSEAKIRLIFIANPNNPTGTFVTQNEIEDFLIKLGNRDDVLLVFDEAYTEFVRDAQCVSSLDYLSKYKNLIVLRTFSKSYGLAAFRIGLMFAHPEVLAIYNRVRKPFNLNSLAQVAAAAALQDVEFLKASREVTWKGLDYFYKKLQELGLPFLRSEGNFVMFDTLRNASQVYEALLKKGIIMRPIGNYGFQTHLRLSVGLMHENEAAMAALAEVLKEIPALK